VIVVIAENSSFDHAFGTFRPRDGQTIHNLLLTGIINEDGTPGPNAKKATQFTVTPQPQYFISAPAVSKTPFATLPPPNLNGVPQAPSTTAPPFTTTTQAAAAEPALTPKGDVLLTTGASGLPFKSETTNGQANGVRNPDTRVANVTNLPSGPYQQTAKDEEGHGLPYDAYTEDTIHRFYQMWQQSDCSVQTATRENPSGCLLDLLPYVITTFNGLTEEGMGTSMAFFNMQQGDAPTLKRFAEEYSLGDNYHQAMMGGTGPNHIMLGTGDAYYFNNSFAQNGVLNATSFTPATPPSAPGSVLGLPAQVQLSLVANPNPVAGLQQRLPERRRRDARRICQMLGHDPARRSRDRQLSCDAALQAGAELCTEHVLCGEQLLPRLSSQRYAGESAVAEAGGRWQRLLLHSAAERADDRRCAKCKERFVGLSR
jgi:phospholipase C